MHMTKSVLFKIVTSFAFPVSLFTVKGHRHLYFPFVGYASLKVLLTSCDTLYQAVVARLIYSLIAINVWPIYSASISCPLFAAK